MLCTRMRLTDRRFQIKSTLSYQNIDGEDVSRASVTTGTKMPFVRPCAVIKMFDCASSDGKDSSNSSRSASARNMHSNAFEKSEGSDKTDGSDKADGSQPSFDR